MAEKPLDDEALNPNDSQDVASEQLTALDTDSRELHPEIAALREQESAPRRWLRRAAGATAVGGLLGAWRQGYVDASYAPVVPVITEITQAMIVANEALRSGAPTVAAGAAAGMVALSEAAHKSRKWKAISEFAKDDYSLEHKDETDVSAEKGQLKRRASRLSRMVFAGTTLVSVAAVTTASAIEHEVKEGPNRALEATFDLLSPTNENPHMIVQYPQAMYMHNSYVDRERLDRFTAAAAEQGIRVVPFRRELANSEMDGGERNWSSLILGVPAELFSELAPDAARGMDDDCSDVPVAADEAAELDVGDRLSINGQPSVVVAELTDTSAMNRIGLVQEAGTMAECMQELPAAEAPYYGAIIENGTEAEITRLFESSDLHSDENAALIDADRMRRNNTNFWAANGTPLVLALTAIGVWQGFKSSRNERRASLQYNQREIGALRALGFNFSHLRLVEAVRAGRETVLPALAAFPIATAAAALVNMAEPGLRVGVGMREVMVGATVTWGAKIVGAVRGLSGMKKELTPAKAIRG